LAGLINEAGEFLSHKNDSTKSANIPMSELVDGRRTIERWISYGPFR
jgi:hypothetical protein